MNKILFVITLSLLLLTSCSVFSPVKVGQETTYVINTLPSAPQKKSMRHVTLLVTSPEINALYRTREIAYTTSPYQIAYFSKNAWAERPSEMIYPLLIQTLQNTHYFHAVVTTSVPTNYDYVLNTQIQELLQDYTHPTGLLYLTVRAQLIRTATNRVIATKVVTLVEPFPQKTPFAGVVAANHATADMLQQLALFCIRSI